MKAKKKPRSNRVASNAKLESEAQVSVWKLAYELITECPYLKELRPYKRSLLTAMTAEALSRQRQIGFYLGKRSNAALTGERTEEL